MDLRAYLMERMPLVERALDAAVPPADTEPTELHAAMRHLLLPGGKRLRPALAFAAAEAVGAPAEAAVPAAVAVELIHTYSLVHDDLPCMDDDDLRRGRPANHRVFGEALAVLAGDGLLTRAFEILASAPELEATTRAQMVGIRIYVDGARRGDSTSELRRIRVSDVDEMRFLSAREATMRFGTDHQEGAILVTLKR